MTLAVFAILAALALRADQLPEHVLQLSRVKARVNQALKTVPDYTCLAVTARYRQELKDSSPRPVDVVRIEVAHANGADLYAWPGASHFETTRAAEMIGAGMYGSGEFASHLGTIFNGYAVMKYSGKEGRLGRQLLRWDYSLAQFASKWQISYASRTAIAGERGSFWADPETLDVVRAEVRSDGLPPNFPIAEVVTQIDYARVRLGSREVLLPAERINRVDGEFFGRKEFQLYGIQSLPPIYDSIRGELCGRSSDRS